MFKCGFVNIVKFVNTNADFQAFREVHLVRIGVSSSIALWAAATMTCWGGLLLLTKEQLVG